MSAILDDRRPTRRRAAVAIATVALTCGTAWDRPSFDESSLRRLLSARGFTARQADSALAPLKDAEARGLPASVLESRLREGLARSARPEVIRRVLDRRLSDLAEADGVMRRGGRAGLALRDRQGSLTRLADSFANGVAADDVANVFQSAAASRRGLDSVSRAAEVMGRLARQGSPGAETRQVLGAALAAGWTREQMDGLVHVYASARRSGMARDKTRRSLAEGIRAGKTLDRLGEEMRARAGGSVARPAAGRSRPGSSGSAASPRSGPSRAAPPKARTGVGPRGPRTSPRGPTPRGTHRAPAPRPRVPRGPAHGPHR